MSEAIIEACRSNPERLAPWLADPRPEVVRGVVHMLGAIGGRGIVGVLQAMAAHADVGVRLEVVNALRGIDPKTSQPVLVRLLADPDARILCGALRRSPRCAIRTSHAAFWGSWSPRTSSIVRAK